MKKKIIVTLLVSTLSMSMLFGCGNTPSYDDIRDEVEEELREEIEEEVREDLEDEIRDEVESSLRAELEDEIKEELRDEIEGEIREELEAEYNDKLEAAIAEYEANNTSSNPPAGTTGYEAAEVTFDVNDFEFDAKNIVFMGTGLTFGTTMCKNVPDEFYGYISRDERNTYYVNSNQYTWITFYPNNTTGSFSTDEGSCYAFYVNATDGPLLLNECALYELSMESKYLKNRSLADEGYYFDLGSGLTEESTYEDFVAILGEPKSDFTYEYDGGATTKYTWGSRVMDGYSLEVTFLADGRITEMDITGNIY